VQVEQTTGVSLDHWLGIVARHTRLDRRLLLRLCRLCGRLPALADAVAARQVSFAQLRGIGLALRDTPVALDADLDRLLTRLLPELVGADPDALITQLRRAVDELAPATLDAEQRDINRHLWLQPNLAGTGGRFCGETDSLGLALLDEATAPTRPQLDHPGGTGAARHDNLLTRLTHTCPTTPTDDGEDGDPDGEHHDHGDPAGAGDDRGDGIGQDRDAGDPTADLTRALPPVQLLVRVELATLLDQAATPAQLLTRLVGGRLRLTAAATRQLIAARGASLRTLVIDHGTVIGVGRRTRIPPAGSPTPPARCTTPAPAHCATGPPAPPTSTTPPPGTPPAPTIRPAAPTSTTSDHCAPPPTAPKKPAAGTPPKPPTAGAPGPTGAPD
jgi:hypothetical protein